MEDFSSSDEKYTAPGNISEIIRHLGRRVNLYEYLTTYPDELERGVLIAGAIGSGKSQYAMRIIKAALDSNYGVIVFEPSTEYQRLIQDYPDAVVISSREFYIAPMEPPPGISEKDWAPIFIQVFAQNFGLKDPSISILQIALNNLLRERSNEEEPISLEEIYQEAQNYNPRQRSQETSSRASVLNRLEQVLNSELNRNLNARHGFSPEDFEQGLIVVQLDPLGIERVHELLVGFTMAKLFAFRTQALRNGAQRGSKVLVVLEEAHRFLSEKRQGDRYGQRTYLERILVESRKLGVGFMIIDQLLHEISTYVLSSSNLWIACKMMDTQSRRVAAEALLLGEMWRNDGIMALPPGGAFIRVERMDDLEKASPLVRAPLDMIDELLRASHPPAIIAAPVAEKELVPAISHQRVRELMCQNRRYLRYFERNIRTDLNELRGKLTPTASAAIQKLLQRTTEQGDYENAGFEEYWGIDMAGISISNEKGSAITRQHFDEVSQNLAILASRACVRVLNLLIRHGKANTSEITANLNLSASWTNRILNRLGELGFVTRVRKSRHGYGEYAISQKGRLLVKWGESLFAHLENGRDAVKRTIEISRSNYEWLKKGLEREMQLRNSNVALAWTCSKHFEETKFRLSILEPHLEMHRPSTNSIPESAASLFALLKLTSRGGILEYLMTNKEPADMRSLANSCDIAESSLRRQLTKLEQLSIVSRKRNSGFTFFQMNSELKEILSSFSQNLDSIRLPLNLLLLLVRSVVEGCLLQILLTRQFDADAFERLLANCRRIDQGKQQQRTLES